MTMIHSETELKVLAYLYRRLNQGVSAIEAIALLQSDILWAKTQKELADLSFFYERTQGLRKPEQEDLHKLIKELDKKLFDLSNQEVLSREVSYE